MRKIFRRIKDFKKTTIEISSKDQNKLYAGMLKAVCGKEKKQFSLEQRKLLRQHTRGLWKAVGLKEYRKALEKIYGPFPIKQLTKELDAIRPEIKKKIELFKDSQSTEERINILNWLVEQEKKNMHLITMTTSTPKKLNIIRNDLKKIEEKRGKLIEIFTFPQITIVLTPFMSAREKEFMISQEKFLREKIMENKIKPLNNRRIHELIVNNEKYKSKKVRELKQEFYDQYKNKRFDEIEQKIKDLAIDRTNIQWTINILRYKKKYYKIPDNQKIGVLENIKVILDVKSEVLLQLAEEKLKGS